MLVKYKYLIAISIPMMVALSYLVVFLVVFRSSIGAVTPEVKAKLVIDHDGGADDAMAIFMALLYEKHFNGPEVIALTTTHGNVDENQVYNNSQRILSAADRKDVLIYRGSAKALIKNIQSDYFFGLDGLGDNNTDNYTAIPEEKGHAALGLIEMSKKYEGNLIVVAIGALTNIALAVRLDPQFISRLSHLYIGAGNIYSEEYNEAEFNAAMDAEAYYIITDSSGPDKLTIIPFSPIRMHQKISKEWRTEVLGLIDTKIMQTQNRYERVSLSLSTYWCLLDPSAMSIVLNEDLVVEEIKYSNNSILLCDDRRGINTNDFTEKDKANSRVVYAVKKETYQKLLIDIFSAELQTIK